jgi:hypothetical protein
VEYEYNIIDDDTFFDTILFHAANSQFIVDPINLNDQQPIPEAHAPNAATFGLGSGYDDSGRSSD